MYKNDLFNSENNKLLDVASERFNKTSMRELLNDSPSKLNSQELESILNLFNNIFRYDITERLSAGEILQHKWLSVN